MHADKGGADIYSSISLNKFHYNRVFHMFIRISGHRTSCFPDRNDRDDFKPFLFGSLPLHNEGPVQMFTALKGKLDLCFFLERLQAAENHFSNFKRPGRSDPFSGYFTRAAADNEEVGTIQRKLFVKFI